MDVHAILSETGMVLVLVGGVFLLVRHVRLRRRREKLRKVKRCATCTYKDRDISTKPCNVCCWWHFPVYYHKATVGDIELKKAPATRDSGLDEALKASIRKKAQSIEPHDARRLPKPPPSLSPLPESPEGSTASKPEGQPEAAVPEKKDSHPVSTNAEVAATPEKGSSPPEETPPKKAPSAGPRKVAPKPEAEVPEKKDSHPVSTNAEVAATPEKGSSKPEETPPKAPSAGPRKVAPKPEAEEERIDLLSVVRKKPPRKTDKGKRGASGENRKER